MSEDDKNKLNYESEQTQEQSEKRNSRTLDLEYLADVAPLVFEGIARNLDRKSIFNILRTSKLLHKHMQNLLKAKQLTHRVCPFRDTTVVINRTYWALGFNRFHFYGYLERAERDKKENIVQLKKPVGKKGKVTEMAMNDLAQRLKTFTPKKIVFEVNYNPFLIERHLQFLTQIEVTPGTTTEIVKVAGHFIPIICAALKPRELILVCPLFNAIYTEEYFKDESFQCVQHLRIREYDASRYQASQTFILEPLSDNLVSFEFTGSIPAYPCEEINILLKKWTNGKNPLKELKFVNRVMHEMEPVLVQALNGINCTEVDEITLLPVFMQKKILKDLAGLDWKRADISYRLLISPPKRQIGCIYYSNFIAAPYVNNRPNITGFSYLGFHAFDYFPLKKNH